MEGIHNEILQKDTGVLMHSGEENDRNVKYSFNTVTDEDVAKPNVNEYEYKVVESN